MTVRCPVLQAGSLTTWEFATEFYDIGFGVAFERTVKNAEGAESTDVQVILPLNRCESFSDVMKGGHVSVLRAL